MVSEVSVVYFVIFNKIKRKKVVSLCVINFLSLMTSLYNKHYLFTNGFYKCTLRKLSCDLICDRYSTAVVEVVEEELFYEVLFDQDCTVCYNLPPSDLLVRVFTNKVQLRVHIYMNS